MRLCMAEGGQLCKRLHQLKGCLRPLECITVCVLGGGGVQQGSVCVGGVQQGRGGGGAVKVSNG
jgi:hypothetical protein